jgi:hypothetical protein
MKLLRRVKQKAREPSNSVDKKERVFYKRINNNKKGGKNENQALKDGYMCCNHRYLDGACLCDSAGKD